LLCALHKWVGTGNAFVGVGGNYDKTLGLDQGTALEAGAGCVSSYGAGTCLPGQGGDGGHGLAYPVCVHLYRCDLCVVEDQEVNASRICQV